MIVSKKVVNFLNNGSEIAKEIYGWAQVCDIFIVNSLELLYHRTWSTLVQVVDCCTTASSHYLNQCSLIISEVLWYSSEDNFTRNAQDNYHWYEFENYKSTITAAAPRGQWVNALGIPGKPIKCSIWHQNDGSVHDCSNSIADALELLQSCTEPLR